ncbi:MAG: hypothetical protein ACXWUG_26155 [Polyangiales bacterium]
MKHVVFAQFPDRDAAKAALDDLSGSGVRPSRCNIVLHASRPGQNSERPLSETHARGGFTLGIGMGFVLGAVMGWLVSGPLHLFEVTIPMGIITGAIYGSIIGFIGGVLSGAMNPDKTIDAMEHGSDARNVIATVEVDGYEMEDAIKRVFASHGGQAVDKRMI